MPGHLHLDRRRHFNIHCNAERPHAGHFRGTDAERKRTERTVACRVGIGPDDHSPGTHVSALGKNLVTDAAVVAADVVELAIV